MAYIPDYVRSHQRLNNLEPNDVDYLAIGVMSCKELNYQLLYERFESDPKELREAVALQILHNANNIVEKRGVLQALLRQEKVSKANLEALDLINNDPKTAILRLSRLQKIQALLAEHNLFLSDDSTLQTLREALDCWKASKSQDT